MAERKYEYAERLKDVLEKSKDIVDELFDCLDGNKTSGFQIVFTVEPEADIRVDFTVKTNEFVLKREKL